MPKPAVPKKAGRPTKYSDEKAKDICDAIAQCNTYRVAALINGVAERTFYEWKERYPQFTQQIEEAEARAEHMAVTALRMNMMSGDTAALKFYLTHRRGDDWRPPKQAQEISGPDGGAILTVVRKEYE